MAALAYFDTSVLAKQYLSEAGHPEARKLIRHNRILSSAIAPVELAFALRRREASGDLTAAEAARHLERTGRDRAFWELVEPTAGVLKRAEGLSALKGLRTLDAIHIASAMTVIERLRTRIPFVTADERQRDAAQRQGLEVVWVE